MRQIFLAAALRHLVAAAADGGSGTKILFKCAEASSQPSFQRIYAQDQVL